MSDLFSEIRRLDDLRCRLRVAGYIEQKSGDGYRIGWRAPDGRNLSEDDAISELQAKEAAGKEGS